MTVLSKDLNKVRKLIEDNKELFVRVYTTECKCSTTLE
jgi:hypothetical protein